MTQQPSGLRARVALAAVLTIGAAAPVHAESAEHKAAQFASHTGNIIFLATAVGLPLLTDGSHGGNHALRAADGIGVAVGITEALKALTKEKRPDSNSHDSFPSGHASAAFAAATMEAAFHPRQAWLWYGGATLISLSRIRLNRHTPADVAVGAAVGYGVARWELSASHGLALQPWIHPDAPGVLVVSSRSF